MVDVVFATLDLGRMADPREENDSLGVIFWWLIYTDSGLGVVTEITYLGLSGKRVVSSRWVASADCSRRAPPASVLTPWWAP